LDGAGSQASLIKSGLASTSSSVAASKRTLSSHDGVVVAAAEPPSTADLDARPAVPSYLGVSRCVGGYSTFTSYAPDRRLPAQSVGDATGGAPTEAAAATTAAVDGGSGTRASEVPLKGGQQCRLTLVDDVVADVRTLSRDDGGGGIVNGEHHSHHRDCDVTHDDAVDGRVPECWTSSANIKACSPV